MGPSLFSQLLSEEHHWSISVLSTALPCFVRGSSLSCFCFFLSFWVSACDANNVISALCLMLSVFQAFCRWLFSYAELFPPHWKWALVYVYGCIWLLRECVLVDLRGFCYCLSLYLSFMFVLHSLTPRSCSCMITSLGSWSSYLLPSLTWLWYSLPLSAVVWIFLENLLSWCPLLFRSNPSPYYFHSNWSIPQ